MNYEALNNNVMLVELTCEDMKSLSLTYDSFDNKEETDSAVKKILKEIPYKTHAKSKIIVEALPIDDGGCFFIFTFSEKRNTRYKVKTQEALWYKTENVNNLLDVISLFDKISDLKTESQVFKYDSYYYLSLTTQHKKLFSLMKEFGEISNFPIKEVLLEYGEYLGKVRL